MRERSELLQLYFQGYPLFQQVLEKDMSRSLFSPSGSSQEEKRLRTLSAYLQLLLQLAVQPCQHCVRLLVSSD